MTNTINKLEDYRGYQIQESLAKILRNREQTVQKGGGRSPIYLERLNTAFQRGLYISKYYTHLTPTIYTSYLKRDTLDVTFFLGAGFLYVQDNIDGGAYKLFDFLSDGDSLKRVPAHINEFPVPIRLRSAPLIRVFDLREKL